MFLFLNGTLLGQDFFKKHREFATNEFIFSDSPLKNDTILFVENTASFEVKTLKDSSKNDYQKYEWGPLENKGASIAWMYQENGLWKGIVRYYYFEITEKEIFGEKILIFKYENKLYFFKIIERRDINYSGDTLVVCKIGTSVITSSQENK